MTGLPFPGIGIVFDIEELGGGFYGYQAWRIFMRHVSQGLIKNTILKEGDTAETLAGVANEFCIAVYSPNLNVLRIKDIFSTLSEKGLASLPQRFKIKPQLDNEPLPVRGKVDALGYFVTDEWMRIDHDLCKEAGWKYKPEKLPSDLPPALKAELESMGR